MELAYPPFEMTDTQGNPTGFSVDLAKELGTYLGKETVIVNTAWDGLIPSLKTGKVDIVLSSMTINEERRKSIQFSDPYAKSYLTMLIAKNSPVEDFKDLDSPGRKVAVKKGTTGHIYAQANLKSAEIMVFDKESACVLEVVQGKADAFLYDPLSIYTNWKKNPETTRVNLKPFQKDVESWGIGLRHEDTALLAEVNAFIKKFRAEGGFERLAEKYLKEQLETFRARNIPFLFD
jgi:polar amino acid transport system substrate-binding protein